MFKNRMLSHLAILVKAISYDNSISSEILLSVPAQSALDNDSIMYILSFCQAQVKKIVCSPIYIPLSIICRINQTIM